MTHRSFPRTAGLVLQEPVTFDLGGEQFTCRLRPSLGDTFELMDAPEPTPETTAQAVYTIARFIRRLLIEEDQERWHELMFTLGQEDCGTLIELASWLAEQFSGFPTEPPASSSAGRRANGTTSKKRGAGTTRSRK